MKDINTCFLIGRLTKDPELRSTSTGKNVVNMSLAVNDFINKVAYANFFDVEAWGTTADNCSKYLKKGSQIAVLGSIRQERWQDKTSGQSRSKIKIIADSVQFLGAGTGKKDEPQQSFTDPWEA